MGDKNSFLFTATNAAKHAGKFLLEQFYKDHNPECKSEKDIVLKVDKQSEKIILNYLQDSFPDHSIYSEELGLTDNNSKYKWFVDPLDGTNNYYVGIPYFSVSIALTENNKPILGVVYNPITDQIFHAEKGHGAFLNDKKIISENKSSSKYSIFAFIKGHSTEESDSKLLFETLLNNCSRLLTMWAPSLDWCQLAVGKIDVLVSFESELEDMLAGLLIAQEAGINVFGFDGGELNFSTNRIAAAQGNIKMDLRNLLKPFSK